MLATVFNSILSQFLKVLDHSDAEQGQPFRVPEIMIPHVDSKFYGWTHYGVMIPDLPEPHRYFSIMSIIGTSGALAFDTDHALKDTPRRNATVVSGTAATHPLHFGGYSIAKDCVMQADGGLVRFGEQVEISGRYPQYRVQAHYGDFALDIEVDATDKVSWFLKNVIYDHLSLLAQYRGVARLDADTLAIAGLCTFEYAACMSPYLLFDRSIPPAFKLPLDFFTYQIINLENGHQLLLTQAMVLGQPLLVALYVRSLHDYSRTYHGAHFTVLEYSPDAAVSPEGVPMRLPRVFRWSVCDGAATVLDLTATIDTPFTYGLGSGYVGAYRYEGAYQREAIAGRGYIEYIDRRK